MSIVVRMKIVYHIYGQMGMAMTSRKSGEANQIHKNKEASERQPHPFCRNRRKDGPPRGVFMDRGSATRRKTSSAAMVRRDYEGRRPMPGILLARPDFSSAQIWSSRADCAAR